MEENIKQLHLERREREGERERDKVREGERERDKVRERV